MASGGEKPDLEALGELEEVLRHLESELASWRRRALSSESRLSDVTRAGGAEAEALSRTKQLEDDNAELGHRLEAAKVRVADLLDRLHFLEQQRRNGGTER